ncbi:hypothetical protein [Streptomyces sp. NPDC005131]
MARKELTASASRYTSRKIRGQGAGTQSWQGRAYDMYHQVPEVRFAASWIGNAMSGARLFAGRRADDGTIEPAPAGHRANEVVSQIAGGPDGQAKMLGAFGKAGTAACGDSRSITVSGVFCDVADDGTVHGLVLVECHYADDGSIDSVRLVDAATGTTSTLQGQLTVCPSGGDDDESPGEVPAVRQVVERCGCDDSDGDGIGDVRYVELWSVDTTGVSPAFLIGTYIDGDFDQPYIPANPVDCQDAGGDESPGEPTLNRSGFGRDSII